MKQLLARLRYTSVVLALALCASPLKASPASANPLGTIVYADRAHVGTSAASLGSTLFGGDRLSTEAQGAVQIRTAAARLKLAATSSAILLEEPNRAAAILTAGMATFSTASSDAFAVHAFEATIKPNSSGPTVGEVMILGKNEIYVKSTRGELVCSVAGEERTIREGEAYRVLLDADPAGPPQGPAGAGGNHPPIKTGQNRAIYLIAGAIAVVTIFAVHEALESPDRP